MDTYMHACAMACMCVEDGGQLCGMGPFLPFLYVSQV